MTQCSRCGATLEPGARFCATCGAAVGQATATAPVDAVGPVPAMTGAPLAPSAPMAEPGYSGTAIASLVLGIASYLGLVFIGAVGAVICGHLARREIRNAGGQLKGDGMALAGLILGYLHFALFCLALGIAIMVFGGLAAAAAAAGGGH